MFGYSKEAVRVKVKKCEGKLQPELRKFSVDPQITSLEVLQSILVKAFDIKSEFTLCFRTVDDYGQEIFLPLLSDWDLDAAFLKAHNIAVVQRSEPCVQLRVDMKPFAEASEDWEPPGVSSVQPVMVNSCREPTVAPAPHTDKQETQTGFQGLIMNHVEKTFNLVSRALNLYEDPNTPPRPPLSDIEFRSFLDAVGQINDMTKLREVIYCGGIDPSLRKVVWKHILNVYPDGMNGKERMDYIKRKANEYYTLRARWKDCIQKGMINEDLAYVTSMVRKDVLRTDRHHTFYAGSDDNQNIASLFNILTTYALYHPAVSYCQGMSDLASPLLVTMGDEAHAYICLCALMARLYPNFLLDGEAMTVKFAHLTEALQVYDPDFYNYLKSQQADDLLFCYRWLLLEMKREFAFDDALRMLEVLWASLPHRAGGVELKPPTAPPAPAPPAAPSPAPRENAYTKLCAIRRQSSSFNIAQNKPPKLSTCKQMNHSLDESSTRKESANASLKHAKEFQSLDDAALRMRNVSLDAETSATDDKPKSSLELKETNSQIRRLMKVPENGRLGAGEGGALLNGNSTDMKLGSQVRQLRDKISNHNQKFHSSFDSSSTETDNKPVKVIKNLNEFLTLCPAAPSADSSPDDSQEYYPMTTSMTRELRLELEHLDRQLFGAEPRVYVWENPLRAPLPAPRPAPRTPDEQCDLDLDDTAEIFEEHSGNKSVTPIRLVRGPADAPPDSDSSDDSTAAAPRPAGDAPKAHKFFSSMSQELENAKKNCESILTAKQSNLHSVATTINNFQKKYESLRPAGGRLSPTLPPPTLFGGGNPFLMFLCLTVLLQHRDYVMRNRMDYNELAMHFDKMVRKHNVNRVLNQARQLYALYLKQHADAPV